MTTPRDEATALLAEALHAAAVNCWPDSSECNRAGRYHDPDAKLILAASPTLAADLEFAAVWRRVERALPDGEPFFFNLDRLGDMQPRWVASISSEVADRTETADTPTAALTRLAEAL